MADVNIRLGLFAEAAGTVNAITATYSPVPASLYDGLMLWFRATGANTITNPTFSPNGLTVRTITKNGGDPLKPGDIKQTGFVAHVIYNLAATRWELVNPAVTAVRKAIFTTNGSGTATVAALASWTSIDLWTYEDGTQGILMGTGDYSYVAATGTFSGLDNNKQYLVYAF